MLRLFPQSAPVTVETRPMAGTQVSTATFEVKVNRGFPAARTAPYYQDRVDRVGGGRLMWLRAGGARRH